MDSQQSKSGKFIHFHSFWAFLPWKSPRLSVWCPRVPSRWVQSRTISLIYLSTVFFLCLETTNNERSQIIIMYLHKIQKKMLFRRSHNSVCAQPRKACPVDSEGDGSAFITRPCLTGEICPGETLVCLCSLNEFRFPFQLLATAQDSFPRSLEHTVVRLSVLYQTFRIHRTGYRSLLRPKKPKAALECTR